jgi:sugar/nucleoside kinase (ribokinase family)
MSILVVGSVAFDDVTSPSGSVKNILGGAATYFSLAASYFTKVRVVAVVGDDFGPEQEKVFAQHNIDTRGLERAKGKTFRWGGSYSENLNEAKTNFTKRFSPAFRRNMKTPIFSSWRIFSRPCRRTCGAR